MSSILLAFGSKHGQTAKIVNRLSERLSHEGHHVTVWRADLVQLEPELTGFDACVVAGSVYYGRHQQYVRDFVRRHLQRLNQMPSAFLSVCGALAPGWKEGPAEAEKYVREFLAQTGWHPALTRSLPGATVYTKYGFITRFIMRQISKRTGRPTDTSRDWEFTDWAEVDRLGWDIAALTGAPAAVAH